MSLLFSLLALSLIGLGASDNADSVAPSTNVDEWPEVREFLLKTGIQLSATRIDLDLPIYDQAGGIRYRLICRGGNEAYLDRVSERTGTAGYLPNLTCILNVGDQETDASLLSEDESAAYYSRGRFVLSDLVGACAHYPEYGLVRHFRLRGMELTLSLSDLTMEATSARGTNVPVYALLSVSVRRDPSALTAKAEQPGYLRPDGTEAGCRIVRRGNNQRMCRNAVTSAWEQCPARWEFRRFSWEGDAR